MSPLLLPKVRGLRREANFSGQPSVSVGTAVLSHSVAHEFPTTYTQLIAATSFETQWVNVSFHTNSGANTNSDSLVTIYVGASSAEQVLIPLLLAGWARTLTVDGNHKTYGFPLRIPAGSRISARHQSVRTSTNVSVMMELLSSNGGGWTGTRVEQVGADTATSHGTPVTPGTTSEGTLTSIGTTTHEWGYLMPMIGGNITDATMIAGKETVDIGTSSAVIPGLEDFYMSMSTNETADSSMGGGRYAHIPAGTALYLRTQFSGVAEAKDYCIYGVF